MKKKERAITLIALVITIIILLILAGVAISTLSGENGLLNKAKEAKEKSTNSQIDENTTLADYETKLNEHLVSNRDTAIVEDYTQNMMYKLNMENISSNPDLTITGTGITTSADKKYLTFDGTSSISVKSNAVDPAGQNRTSSDVTMCCWYRTTSSIKETIMVEYGENGAVGNPNIHYIGFYNNNIGAFQGYATCGKGTDPSNVNDGNWHFLVGIWKNNNTVMTYYDGVPFTGTGSYTNSNSYLNIGGISDFPSDNYTGDLSEVRVYNAALTESNIKQLFEYGKNYLGI